MSQTTPAAGRPGPSLRLSLVVFGVGLAIGVVGAVGAGAVVLRGLFGGPAYAVPSTFDRHLRPGDYNVYEREGTPGGAGFPFDETRQPTTLTPDDVTIVGPGGAPLSVRPAGGADETLTRGSASYTAAVAFTADRAGYYRFDIRPPGGSGEVVIAPTLGETVQRMVPWGLALGGGGLLATAGLVMVIAGVVRRNRADRQVPAYALGPPAGWYPDPSGSGRHRWWDGTRWTDHTG